MNKTIATIITACALLAGCGDGLNEEPLQEPLPVIEGARYFAEAHCVNLLECERIEPEQLDLCILLNQAQLCDLFLDCTRDATEEEVGQILECEADVSVRECGADLPDSCYTVLGY